MKKYELITIAMYSLGGEDKGLDIEDIAMKCEELSPGTFSWRKYKNQINLELVGFAVRDAKKERYGSLVSGSHAKGWRLTASGVTLAKSLATVLDSAAPLNVEPTNHRSMEINRAKREINRISESLAFLNWGKKKEITQRELEQLLRINAYASKESIDIKLARLSGVKGIDDDIDSFIDYVISKREELI